MTFELQPDTWLLLRKVQAVRLLTGEDRTLDEIVSSWSAQELGHAIAKVSTAVQDLIRPSVPDAEPEFTEPPVPVPDLWPEYTIPPESVAPTDGEQPAPATRNRRTKEEMQAAHDAVLARYRATLAAGISRPLSLEAAVREGTVQKLSRKVVEGLVAQVVADDAARSADPFPVTPQVQRVQDIVTNEQPPKHDPTPEPPLAKYADMATDGNGSPPQLRVPEDQVDDIFASFLSGV